jgi:hypothetical protein
MSKSSVKKKPVLKEEYRNKLRKWKIMKEKEGKRLKQLRLFNRYKNEWLLNLVMEATRTDYWRTWDIARLKNLRDILENDYHIPVNFFSAFVYYTTYRYMSWSGRDINYMNYVGFLCNENSLIAFANFAGKKSILWRKKTSRWPPDWEKKWGIRTSVRIQKIGKRDKFIEEDVHSEKLQKRINKYIN